MLMYLNKQPPINHCLSTQQVSHLAVKCPELSCKRSHLCFIFYFLHLEVENMCRCVDLSLTDIKHSVQLILCPTDLHELLTQAHFTASTPESLPKYIFLFYLIWK